MTETTDTPRVLSLSESAERLNMKRSNVGKFLARRNVQPAFSKAQGYFYWEADIDRVKAEREADKERMAADAKRRRSALAGHGKLQEVVSVPPELARLGATQRALLSELLRHPVKPETDAERLAMRRLRQRGFVSPVATAEDSFDLTVDGRTAAGHLP
jgi:hypothetical protein